MTDRRGESLAVPNTRGTLPPQTSAPAGSVDCHIHIFDPRYPFIAGRSPGVGTVADYLLFRRRVGVSRCIVVAPSSYGTDNRCLMDALAQFGDTARGVASLGTDVSDSTLQELHAGGVRGVRMNFGRTAVDADALVAMAKRIQPYGWHLQVHMLADSIVQNEYQLATLPLTLVLDHMGRAPQPGGLHHPVVRVLERLLAKGNTYVKLSHYYEEHGAVHADYAPLARHLIACAPDRMVWASDWPHGTQTVKPDAAAAFDQLAVWTPDASVRRRILVDNPNALYWRD